jgi:hypothetical protein
MHATPLAPSVVDACIAALLAVNSCAREDAAPHARLGRARAAVAVAEAARGERGRRRRARSAPRRCRRACRCCNEAVNGGHLFTVLDERAHHHRAARRRRRRRSAADSEYPADEMIVTLRQLLASDSIPPRIVGVRASRHRAARRRHCAVAAARGHRNGLALPSAAARVACLGAMRALRCKHQSPARHARRDRRLSCAAIAAGRKRRRAGNSSPPVPRPSRPLRIRVHGARLAAAPRRHAGGRGAGARAVVVARADAAGGRRGASLARAAARHRARRGAQRRRRRARRRVGARRARHAGGAARAVRARLRACRRRPSRTSTWMWRRARRATRWRSRGSA